MSERRHPRVFLSKYQGGGEVPASFEKVSKLNSCTWLVTDKAAIRTKLPIHISEVKLSLMGNCLLSTGLKCDDQ